jgi:hypothetical protein
MSAIGSGQHVWVQMWGGESGEEVIADGVLYPGEDVFLTFSDGPQLVAKWSLTRITKEHAERLAQEKGIKQEIPSQDFARELAG